MLSKLQTLKEEREQGFTLIELLVVILIIGILSAIAIPAFMNQRKSAVDSSVQSDVSNAAKAVETWIVKQGATAKTIDTAAVNGVVGPPVVVGMSIKKSDGTVLVINGNSQAYTITGSNPGGDQALAANGGFVYNNTTGGLAKGTGTAVTTGTAPNVLVN